MSAIYQTWRNVVMSDDSSPIVNTDPRMACRHCDNAGIVMLDTDARWVPCPMCLLGGRRGVEYATGTLAPRTYGGGASQPRGVSFTGRAVSEFWEGADMRGVTWNRGLTYQHDRVCSTYECEALVTRTGPCRLHDPNVEPTSYAIPPRVAIQTLEAIEPERYDDQEAGAA